MASRICRRSIVGYISLAYWLLIGWLTTAVTAAESSAGPAIATIQFADGDSITGQLVDSPADSDLGWQSPRFAAPFHFVLDAVNAVHFPVPGKLPPPEGAYCFELAGGDVLFGALISLDGDVAVLDVPGLGQLHVERANLRRMYRWDGGSDLLFLGPSGLNGWQTVGKAKVWREEGGDLITDQSGAVIRRDFSAPPKARFEFEISWKTKPDFELALAVGPDPKTALRAFRFEVWENELVALRETEREADVATIQKITDGAGRIHLQAFIDQQEGRMLVFSASGEPLADLTVSTVRPQDNANGKLPSFGGLQLTNKRGDIRLERLWIGRWNGESPHAVQADKATIFAADGKIAHGQLKSYDAATREFVMQDGEQERRVAESQVHDVFLSQSKEAAPRSLCAVHLSGLRISGDLVKIEEHKVWLKHPAIRELLGMPVDSLYSLMVLRHQNPLPALAGREGRLELDGIVSHGCLVDGRDTDAGSVVWQPRQSRNASPLNRDVSARVVYRDPPPPPKPQRTNPQQVRRVVRNGAVVDVQKQTIPNAVAQRTTTPVLHLRSGDTVTCTVASIDEKGVKFASTLTEATFVPHDQLKAIELMPEAKPVAIAKLKKERLMMLPRMQRDNPPTHLIRAVDGDYLRGRLVEMDEKKLHVEVRLETKTIPRDKVARIIWLHADELLGVQPPAATDDSSKGMRVQALPNQGSRLTFFAQQLEGAILSGRSELLGGCRVNLEQIDQLLIGPAIEQSVATLAFHQWRLTAAAEPLTPNEGGEGGGDGSEGLESALVGKPAPDFELELLDGKNFHLADHKDKIVILDFWASWCGPCLQVMPQVDAVAEEFAEKDVELFAINLQESPEQVTAALDRLQLKMPVALDREGLVAEKYGATAIPQTVIIDRGGRVARLFVGGGARFNEQLRDALQDVLNSDP